MSSLHVTDTPDALWGVDDDRKDRNEGRARDAGLEPCATCGRGVKPGSGWLIEVVDGGAKIARPGTADTKDPGYLGCWVLGPECGKYIPGAFKVRNEAI